MAWKMFNLHTKEEVRIGESMQLPDGRMGTVTAFLSPRAQGSTTGRIIIKPRAASRTIAYIPADLHVEVRLCQNFE